MKNITSILSRGTNLTPREKFLLLVKNDTQKLKTGKDMLTNADKEALENWHAKTNEEAREWNQLNEGWQLSGRMNIEAEFAYKEAQVAYLSQLPLIMNLLFYPGDRRADSCIKNLKHIKKVTINEAMAIVAKQREAKLREGMDFEHAVYQLAFEQLSKDDATRMEELYQEVAYEHQYLDQEEIIAHLYDGKSKMSPEAKEKLAELVAEQSYNKFAKEYQLFHYFACIPLVEVARYFLKDRGIKISGSPMAKNQEMRDEDDNTYNTVTRAMQKYAKKHRITIKAMLREACRKWLDDGLLDEYTPLAVSDDADLLRRWFESKANAKKTLLTYIASGALALRSRNDKETRKDKLYSKGLYDREFAAASMVLERLHLKPIPKGELDEKKAFETFSDKVITGESLYAFGESYTFVKDFKEQVDTYNPNLGLVYADNDIEKKGDHLDQELLICDHAENDEPGIFSMYGISITMLSGLLKARVLFEEFKKDGKIFLKFKNLETAQTFAERRQRLINGYAILLGFKEVLKKLSPTYEIDMTEQISERLSDLREYIEQHNQALRIATNTDEESRRSKSGLLWEKETMQFEEDLTIDIGAIEPDRKTAAEHEAKLKEVFPEMGRH